MFVADPRITHIRATPEQVVAIWGSLNKPHIAVPGKAAQEVQGWVVAAYTSASAITLFVYLYLTQTSEGVVYVDHDRLRVEPSALEEAQADALGFLESMGFMLEPMNVAAMAAPQRAELLKSMPCFSRDHRAAPAADARAGERADTPQARLARMLASF